MKLSSIQEVALKNILKHRVFYYSMKIDKVNIGAFWVDKTSEVKITDSTMRRLRNFGLVEFGRTSKTFLATLTDKGEKVGRKI